MAQMHNPPHPGEVLSGWLEGIEVTQAAKSLGVTRVTLSRLLNGAAGVSAEMDLRLSKALGTSPGLWLGMQSAFDLWKAGKVAKLGRVTRIAVANAANEDTYAIAR
jgi:addiction module HigA family antidote